MISGLILTDCVVMSRSCWGGLHNGDPWDTGLSPGVQNTYPRGQFPTLVAGSLLALRALAEEAAKLGEPRAAVHLLSPLLWCCVDLGSTAITACCAKAGRDKQPNHALSPAEAAEKEVSKCLQFCIHELLPKLSSAAFDREVMLPPYTQKWPARTSGVVPPVVSTAVSSALSDSAAAGATAAHVWPPAPKPLKGDGGKVRVSVPWHIFAKKDWRGFISLRSLGTLVVELLKAEATAPAAAEAAAAASASVAHLNAEQPLTADQKYAMASAAAAETASVFAAQGVGEADQSGGLAVLKKILPKADRVPSTFQPQQEPPPQNHGYSWNQPPPPKPPIGPTLSSAQKQ